MNTEALIEALNAIYRAVTDKPILEKDRELFQSMKLANERIAYELKFKRNIETESDWIPIPWPGLDGRRNWEAAIYFISKR